jgi:peptide subunit release factor 1 (eRF1)
MQMFTEKDLRELLEFKTDHQVLSVYLNTDPTLGSADAYKPRLRGMLKDVNLEDDVETVEHYINFEFDWSGKGLALFSCAEEDFFRAFPFAVPLRDRVRISERPYVKPLADLLDFYGGYGIALVDKIDARLLYFHLGEILEQREIVGENVRRTKRGGGSQAPGRRGGTAGQTNYTEEVAERNIKDSAELAASFFNEYNVRRVIIGGTEENVNAFRSHLPKAWQSLVVGSFPISKTASQTEIMERAQKAGQEAEGLKQVHLIETIVTSEAKGRQGVTNLEDTLNAVHDGRVQTLVIRDGYRAPGFRCQGCGYLTTEELKTCPFCGHNFENIPDAVELAVRRVMRDGGEVEVIHNLSQQTDFDQVGALLRY